MPTPPSSTAPPGIPRPDQRVRALLAGAGLATGEASWSRWPGGTSAAVFRVAAAEGTFAAKIAAPGLPVRRVDAEAHVLGTLGPAHGLPVPRLLSRADDDLLMAWIEPTAIDAALPLEAVFDALSRIHAVSPGPDGPLDAWGAGTAGDPRPHERRARRLTRRIDGFLEHLDRARAGNWRDRLTVLAETYAAACSTVAGLSDRRLIHGDLHPGNVIPAATGPVLIDWQQASIGPAAVDVTRLLVESGTPAEHADELAAAAAPGVPGAVWDALRRTTLGGLVSGFGARSPGDLAGWERSLIERSLRPGGWLDARMAGPGT